MLPLINDLIAPSSILTARRDAVQDRHGRSISDGGRKGTEGRGVARQSWFVALFLRRRARFLF